MNTHFDIATDQDRKRTAALRSLSLEAPPRNTQSPRRRRRHLILLTCLSLGVGAGFVGILLHRPDMSEPKPVEMALSQDGEVTDRALSLPPIPTAREITGSGFVVAPRMTAVFSKYEGTITHIAVALGDTVDAGQIVARLDDSGAGFALDQAKAAQRQAELVLDARKIDVVQARNLLDRTKILAARDATSVQALEEARTAMERASNAEAQAQQSIDSAAIAVRIARERVEELSVRAPFAGTITQLNAHVGDTVLARVDSVREDQSLLTITDTANLVIDVDVAETNVADMEPNLHGEAVLDGFPNQPFPVTVLRLAPVVSAEKGTVTLRLSLADPPDGIRPNMAARIRITLDKTGEPAQ